MFGDHPNLSSAAPVVTGRPERQNAAVRKTIQPLLAEYGAVAVVIYFAIFFAVLFGFWAAIRLGWSPRGAAGGVGAFTAAYLATKLTQPLRIGATVVLTPLVAKGYERVFGPRAKPAREPSITENADGR